MGLVISEEGREPHFLCLFCEIDGLANAASKMSSYPLQKRIPEFIVVDVLALTKNMHVTSKPDHC